MALCLSCSSFSTTQYQQQPEDRSMEPTALIHSLSLWDTLALTQQRTKRKRWNTFNENANLCLGLQHVLAGQWGTHTRSPEANDIHTYWSNPKSQEAKLGIHPEEKNETRIIITENNTLVVQPTDDLCINRAGAMTSNTILLDAYQRDSWWYGFLCGSRKETIYKSH